MRRFGATGSGLLFFFASFGSSGMCLLPIKKKSFPLTDNGKESSRSSCAPALILHAERKSTPVESDGNKVCTGVSSFKNLFKLLNCTNHSQDKGLSRDWSCAGDKGLFPTVDSIELSIYNLSWCFIGVVWCRCQRDAPRWVSPRAGGEASLWGVCVCVCVRKCGGVTPPGTTIRVLRS